MKKLILITGTTNGIGQRLKEHFLSKGFAVIGLDKEVDTYINDSYEFLHIDLAADNCIAELKRTVGDRSLYAIINNAAEFDHNPLVDFDIDRFNRSQLVNATMPLAIVASLSDQLEDNVSKVVSITSGDAYFAAHEDLGYAASKASLANITKSMAAELGRRGIRVNAVSPGWVDTNMGENAGIEDLAHAKTPLGRNATTQEIADLIDFLIDHKSSFINGSIIAIDGGYTIIDTVVKEEYKRHTKEQL